MSKQFPAKKTKKTLNKLQIFFKHNLVFDSFGIWCITTQSLPDSLPAKRTVLKIVLQFPISSLSSWTMYSLMSLVKLRQPSSQDFWKSRTRKIPMFPAKATNNQILATVDGNICAEQAQKLRIILILASQNRNRLFYLQPLNIFLNSILIMTVLGIQSFAAVSILSEIGADMPVFPSSKHLCSRAGLTPQITRVP